MYSSFNPWEFKQNFPNLLKEGKFGLYGFSCYDAFLSKLFINQIPSHFVNDGWKVIAGADVTVSWLEENLSTLDFFNTAQSYKVLMSEQMNAKAKEFLLNEKIDWGERYFLLSFSKEDKFFDGLKKKKEFTTLKVTEPKFWEQAKLMKFLCELSGIYLSVDVQNCVLELIPNEPGDLLHAMKKMALFIGGDPRKITRAQAEEVLGYHRIDQFELARVWGDGKMVPFLKSLLKMAEDYDDLMLFFRFMQGHIIKMIDPSYMQEKNRLSKYDKQIESQNRRWSKADLTDELRFFGDCEILAKSKSPELKHRLRLKLISTYVD